MMRVRLCSRTRGLLTHISGKQLRGVFEATLFEASPRIGARSSPEIPSTPASTSGRRRVLWLRPFGPGPRYDLVKTLALRPSRWSATPSSSRHDLLNIYTDIPPVRSGAADALKDFFSSPMNVRRQQLLPMHSLNNNKRPSFAQDLPPDPRHHPRRDGPQIYRNGCSQKRRHRTHLTNALNGLKNILMDEENYLRTVPSTWQRAIDRGPVTSSGTTKIVLEPCHACRQDREGRYRITTGTKEAIGPRVRHRRHGHAELLVRADRGDIATWAWQSGASRR